MRSPEIVDQFVKEEMRREPYEFYAHLRDEAPIFWSEYLGSHVISRFDDVRFVLDNAALFSSKPPFNQTKALAKYAAEYSHLYAEAGVPAPLPTLVTTDGAVHKRYRSMVDAAFGVAGVRRQERMVERVIDEVLDEYLNTEGADLYRDFSLKIPLYVICNMLGLPLSGASLMQRAGQAAIRLAAGAGEDAVGLLAAHRTTVEFQSYLLPFVKRSRKSRTDDLIGHLAHGLTVDGDHLSDQEILSLVQVMNVGGNETTTNGIGNMFEKLLADPALEQRLRADRSLIPRFVEEAVRLESPVCGMPRWATAPVEVGGVAFKAGDCLHVRFGAANRDERRFACPAQVDLARSSMRNHVGFGSGPHYCLGANLARFELRITLDKFFDRVEAMWLDPGAPKITYDTKLQVRALTGLPIRVRETVKAT
jgi:cytochrome P450